MSNTSVTRVFASSQQQVARSYLVALTTFSAASFIVSATTKFSPDCFRISLPCSTLVPSSRSTTGIPMFVFFAASTTPFANVSTRRMPPKMLMSTALTFLSLKRISNACSTCSALAPPPTSRKFAGLEGLKADRRINRLLENCIWILRGNLFDLHSTGRGGHEDQLRRRTIQHNAEVQLALDGQSLFNQQALHLLSLRPGLMCDQLHAKDLARKLLSFFRGLRELHATAFAASA